MSLEPVMADMPGISGDKFAPCSNHWVGDLFGCDPKMLNDMDGLVGVLFEAAKAAGATPLQCCQHQFTPKGLTILLLLSESHLSIHTWPERGFAAVDAFTCGRTADAYKAVMHIARALKTTDIMVQKVDRKWR